MKRSRPLSDKAKLVIALWVLLSAGFVATTLVSYFVSRDAIRESIVATELPLTADNVYSEIQKDLVRPIVVSSMMCHDTFLRDWMVNGERDPEQITRYLREVVLTHSAFTSFVVSETTQTYYQAAGILKKVSVTDPRDAWYFRVRDMSEPYEINVDPDLANRDKLTIFINYRVVDSDQHFIGATGVGLTVDAVIRMIDDYQQRYSRSIYLVDTKGRIVLSGTNGSTPHGTLPAEMRAIGGLGDQADAILRAGRGSFEYVDQGHRHFLNLRYIPELKWYLIVVKQEDRALADIQQALYINLLLCAAITAIVLLIVYFTINHYQRRLERMATTDNLTGLANRHALDVLLDQATREAARQSNPTSAIILDIDRFKELNDSRGHLAGDYVLQGVAATLRESLRSSDIACRWGGEEFLVILKNTDLASAARVAHTIRERLEQQRHEIDGATVAITISAGVAAYRPGEPQESFIARADALLYQAKQEGRNRVCHEAIEDRVGSV